MKILHVLPSLAVGGMEQLVIRLAADAAAHGDTVVVASGPGVWVERVVPAVPYMSPCRPPHGTPRRHGSGNGPPGPVHRQVRPHVVQAHNIRATLLARLALMAARHQAALMPTLHGLAPGDYGAASRVLRLIGGRVIACAPSVARSLRRPASQ